MLCSWIFLCYQRKKVNMMRAQYNLSLLFSSLFLVPSSVFATSVISTAPGGDPTTGYQETAPTFADGDTIRGHAMFKKGFTIPVSATVTWDGDGLVEGPIVFTNSLSILNLSADLRLGTTGSLSGSDCEIKGNGYKIILGNDLTMSAGLDFCARSLFTNDHLTLDGQGHWFSCPSVHGFFGSPGSSITLKNMTFNVYDWANEGGVFWITATNQLILENMTITGGKSSINDWQLLCWNWDGGPATCTIRGLVTLSMPSRRLKWNWGSAITVAIEKNSTLYIGKDTIFEVMNSINGGSVTFVMADETSVLHLDGCDFYTGANGLTLTKGTVIFENKVRIFNKDYDGASNADMSKALIFGDGTVAGDVNVRVLGDAYVTLDGCMKYNHS